MSDREQEIADLEARLAALKEPPSPSPAPVQKSLKKAKTNNGGIAVLGIAGMAIAILIAMASKPMPPPTPETAQAPVPTASAPAPPRPNWTYSESKDELRGVTTYIACTTSENLAQLSPPYQPVTAELCLRRGPPSTVAYVMLDGAGQIICRPYDDCRVAVSFGDARPVHFPGAEAADNSSNIIFIEGVKGFADRLRRSRRAVVELTLYEAGNQQLKFNTSGLKWP